MFSARDKFKQKLEALNNKISDTVDFDFSTVSKNIDTIEQFETEIMCDFLNGKQLFYRGERMNTPERNLLPSMLRNQTELFKYSDLGIVHIDSDFIYNYYSGLGKFVEVFDKTIGRTDENNLYNLCAFAQHYYSLSPLIDFTKNVYTSLSFALKDREYFNDDIVLYVLELRNKEDYTNDIHVANEWLKGIDVYVSQFDETDVKAIARELIDNKHLIMTDEFRRHMEQINKNPVPRAKLIDVPTNTRMKFQQGVFLMLTDFQLYKSKYLTKNIREHFTVTKFIINKKICPQLVTMIKEEAPWYSFRYLTNVDEVFKRARESGSL